jgi:ribose transport system permease protein
MTTSLKATFEFPPRSVRRRLWIALDRVNVILYLFVLLVGFGLAAPQAFTPGAASTVLQLSIPLLVAATGMTICLICGEVDLSMGGVAGLASTVAALLMSRGMLWPLAVLAALLVGLVVGAINGALTTWLASSLPRFPSFLVTLASLSGAMGLAQSLQPMQQAIAINDPAFGAAFGFGRSALLSPPLWYAVAIMLITHFVLSSTTFGYAVKAIGANSRAARLVGFSVLGAKFSVMTISGLFAAAAGALLAGFVQAGFANIARGIEVDAIAAAVIGGTALFGGRGTVLGTALGVIILGVLNTGLLVLQAPTNQQLMVKGALVIVALAVAELIHRRVALL